MGRDSSVLYKGVAIKWNGLYNEGKRSMYDCLCEGL